MNNLNIESIKVQLKPNIKILLLFGLILFVISFQVQWTEFIWGTEIRFSCSDFLLVFVIIACATKICKYEYTLIFKSFRWPLWFLVFTLWFACAIIIGYFETGIFSYWAFVNKFIGWTILAAYFFLGNIIITIDSSRINVIMRSLFISSSAICVFNIIFFILYTPPVFLSYGANDNGRFVGFLVNPNAYGLFSVFVVLLQIPFVTDKKIFPIFINGLLIFLNISAIFLSGSRTAMIAFMVGLISFIISNALNRKKFFIVLLFLIIALGFVDWQKVNNYLYTRVTEFYILDHAVEERLESTILAIQWWIEKPLTGIGLGSFLVKQNKMEIIPIMTIHNTPLWLLTETGVIGLLLYGWFLFKGRNEVLKRTKEYEADRFAKGMLTIFPAFIVASLTTEIFYQRYIWFFLGLVLAKHQEEQMEHKNKLFPTLTSLRDFIRF